MELLYSNILPVGLEDNQKTIQDCFNEQIGNCDSVEIAVGYVSKASLEELDSLVEQHHIRHISLVIGMYYVEGMPESSYHAAVALNQKWREAGIGEIRLTKVFKYHGKLYAFIKDGQAVSAIIGSANLGVIKLEANNRRQYEVSAVTTDPSECSSIMSLICKMQEPRCSANIADITDMTLIREVNTSLTGVDTVDQVPQAEVAIYQRHKTDTSFILPIKVPAFAERHMDDGKHYTKSNLNVSYAAPRSARKSRDWYETQFTVGKSITLLPGYPEKNKTFYVITDDGYTFKAHTTSDGNKQFSAVGDELILGRWIKGRLAAAGLVTPVNDTQKDQDRLGMITKEMLKAYGCDTLVLTKTDQKMEDEEGNLLDVWFLSFEKQQEKSRLTFDDQIISSIREYLLSFSNKQIEDSIQAFTQESCQYKVAFLSQQTFDKVSKNLDRFGNDAFRKKIDELCDGKLTHGKIAEKAFMDKSTFSNYYSGKKSLSCDAIYRIGLAIAACNERFDYLNVIDALLPCAGFIPKENDPQEGTMRILIREVLEKDEDPLRTLSAAVNEVNKKCTTKNAKKLRPLFDVDAADCTK